jgi:hypothetical protein
MGMTVINLSEATFTKLASNKQTDVMSTGT